MQNIGVFWFIGFFPCFALRGFGKAEAWRIFFAECLKNEIIRRHDSTHGTAYYECYCIFTACFLVVFWLLLVVFDNDEDNKFKTSFANEG